MKRSLSVTAVVALAFYVVAPLAVADTIPLSSMTLVDTTGGTTTKLIDGGSVLQLTPNFDTGGAGSPAGAAWTPNTVNVANGFSVNFQFEMSDPTGNVDSNGHGGDGIAFVIQNESPTAIGIGSDGLGFEEISDSVAVMFDTYQNNSDEGGTRDFDGDPSDNYIAINTLGTQANYPNHFCTDGLLTATPGGNPSDTNHPGVTCTVSPTLAWTGGGVLPGGPPVSFPALTEDIDTGVHDVGITYNGSVMDVYLDSTLVLSAAIDLGTLLDLQGGTNAYLGFTAGDRFAYQNQDILSFAMTPEPVWGQVVIPLATMLVGLGVSRRWRNAKG